MYYYIINPAAGGGKINKVQTRLKERLKDLGIAGEFVKSTGPGDIAKLARLGIEKNFKTIVAVGGDGTIHEMINGIDNDKIAIGIIPLGATNELAHTLGIPDWQSACNILSARKTEVVDLGIIKNRFFVTNVSLGFNTFLFENLNPNPTSFLEKFKTGFSLFREAMNFKTVVVTLDFEEGFSVEAECFNVTISNGKFLKFMPKKLKPQDSLLDVVILSKLPFTKVMRYSNSKSGEKIRDLSKISTFRTKRVRIKTKKPYPVIADGQIVAETPVTVAIAEKKLRVIVSRERKF